MYNESRRGVKSPLITDDGSQTLYSSEFEEAYHGSRDGALRETMQKHVLSAFGWKSEAQKLTILDICFGLGYNTLATVAYVKNRGLSAKIEIIAPEMDLELVRSLADFPYPPEFEALKPIIQALSKEQFYEDEQFRIEIPIGDARAILPKLEQRFDIVYQDAFSPKRNPLLWTREYFGEIRSLMRDDAILTTYSIAASVRMGLHENGFHIFMRSGEGLRDWMAASPQMPEGAEPLDMELKIRRNPDAKSLRDSDFIT